MRVLFENPPLFDEIDAAFKVAGKPIIFCWGRLIYNPQRIDVSPSLHAHEVVHATQQMQRGGPEAWWGRYIAEPAFRLEQEIPAHRQEYIVACLRRRRLSIEEILDRIAGKLAAPLYGNLVTLDEARRLLRP